MSKRGSQKTLNDGPLRWLANFKSDFRNGIQSKGLLEIPEVPESCLNPNKQCDASYPYRSMDGTCNNLQHPYWGAAFTPLTRLVPAAYNDGNKNSVAYICQ